MAPESKQAPEAFRTFALDPPYAARTIRAQLLERIKALSDEIVGGYAQHWPDYQRRIGVIEGLQQAIVICEEMELKERQ